MEQSGLSAPPDIRKTHPVQWNNAISCRIQRNMEARLLKWLIKNPPAPGLMQMLCRQTAGNNIRKHCMNTAQQAEQQCFQNAFRNGEPVPGARNRINQRIQGIIYTRFIKNEMLMLCDYPHAHRGGDEQMRVYNQTVLNDRVFRKIRDDSPHVLRFYQQITRQQKGQAQKVKSAEALTRTVQEASGLVGAAWRYLTQIGWKTYCWTDVQQEIEEIRLGFQALTDANRPEAHLGLLRAASQETRNHNFFRDAQWDHGDPWRAWVHLLNQHLLLEASATRQQMEGRQIELRSISDALRWHVEHQQPWGRTDWDSYLRRSDRWHLELNRERGRTQDREISQARWTSAIGETNLGGITIKPVSNGTELQKIGKSMDNCLSTYWRKCLEGTDRIFSVWRDETLVAAAQITRTENTGTENTGKEQTGRKHTWTTTQIEGPRRTLPDEEIKQAMREICKMYQKAEFRETA